MSDHVRKLCLLGDSGVGKSAIAARLGASPAARPDGLWVHYWTAPEGNIPCALWDLRGRSSLDSLSQAFLAHADGFALIADAGNHESIQAALQVGQMAAKLIGERPQVLILNQFDGAVCSADVAAMLAPNIPAFFVSAGTGEGVEAAFAHLAQAVSTV
ncbi:MAG: GTPase domain-containing protein [Pseudomarimonas sp.]